MSEKSRFTGTFHKQLGKRAQTLLKSARRHLYHIYWSLRKQFGWKKSLLVLQKILRLFVNTLSADDKNCLLNRGNLTQSIQIQLSMKQNTFAQFFSAFLIFTLNSEHFQKKDDPHRRCISEITDSENVIR